LVDVSEEPVKAVIFVKTYKTIHDTVSSFHTNTHNGDDALPISNCPRNFGF